MSYPAVEVLDKLWCAFENAIKNIHEINLDHLPEIKKLMTAEAVVDLSLHEIYPHAGYVHDLTRDLLQLKNSHPDDNNIVECCQHWLEILKNRNQIPLKLKHHQRADGECDFRFSLQLMEGKKPCGFKEIQVLNHESKADIDEAIKVIYRLDNMAAGISFANLPLVKNTILTSLMEYKDVVCLLAKDQSDQIIGHCWGVLLKGVENSKKEKVNVFWVMELARDADFYDEKAKVGEQLRVKLVEHLKARGDCDFVGYQHVLNHHFHMGIVGDAQNTDEIISINNEKYPARTSLNYSEDLNLFVRVHFIRANANNFEYPEHKLIKPAILASFWGAAHKAKDFIFGGLSFSFLEKYNRLTHNLQDSPVDERLIEPVSDAQKTCDAKILKELILSDKWKQKGVGIFRARHVPATMEKLQSYVRAGEYEFQDLKTLVANSGRCLTRGAMTASFYAAIKHADSPTFVLNSLLGNKNIPNEWIELITNRRAAVMSQQADGIVSAKTSNMARVL